MKKHMLVISADSMVGQALWGLPSPEPINVVTTSSVAEAILSIVKHDYALIVADNSLCTPDIISALRKATEAPILEVNTRQRRPAKVMQNFCAEMAPDRFANLEELRPRAIEILVQACHADKYVLRCSVRNRHDLVIVRAHRRVFLNERELPLTRIEYEILCLLATRQGMVFSYDFIFDSIWYDFNCNAKETVRNHITRLRKKMGSASYVEAVHGVGYRLAQYHEMEHSRAPMWGTVLQAQLSKCV